VYALGGGMVPNAQGGGGGRTVGVASTLMLGIGGLATVFNHLAVWD
jgi:hypothetical protein